MSQFIEMLLICGICFVIFGIWMSIFPPKEINSWYGYRTSSSMKNKENWTFAQKFSAKVMIAVGLGQMALSTLSFVIVLDEENRTLLAIFVLVMSMVVLIMCVERAIKKNQLSNKL